MADNDVYPRLWHFTCRHGRAGIGRRGEILCPVVHPVLGVRVSWFTELAFPNREATGLTMHHTRCDRMAYRYRVLTPWRCERWLDSALRRAAPGWYVDDLESFGDPGHWWIAGVSVPAVLDGTYRRRVS